jgi:hypothetical protein
MGGGCDESLAVLKPIDTGPTATITDGIVPTERVIRRHTNLVIRCTTAGMRRNT